MADPVTPFTEGNAAPAATPATQEPTKVQDPAPVVNTEPKFDIPDTVKEFIGEGKKYASIEAALASIPHAQSHIATLEGEMGELREDLIKRKTAEEILAEINKKPTEEQTIPQFDPSQLDALIENKMAAKEQQVVRQANVSTVVDKFAEVYGDKAKAEEVYINKAKELGLSIDYLNNLAATSPKAVFELYGIKSVGGIPAKVHSDVNTEADPPVQPKSQPKSVMGGVTNKEMVTAWKSFAREG